jgi:hypothetical protein
VNSTTIRDMLFVNQLEKRLGRRLSREEVETEEYEEELEIYFPDGHREFIRIPRLSFPDDLMSRPGVDSFEIKINEDEDAPVSFTQVS